MLVNNVVTFHGIYVDVQEKSGNIHKYARLEPGKWLWINSAYANYDPRISTALLEKAYAESMK